MIGPFFRTVLPDDGEESRVVRTVRVTLLSRRRLWMDSYDRIDGGFADALRTARRARMRSPSYVREGRWSRRKSTSRCSCAESCFENPDAARTPIRYPWHMTHPKGSRTWGDKREDVGTGFYGRSHLARPAETRKTQWVDLENGGRT